MSEYNVQERLTKEEMGKFGKLKIGEVPMSIRHTAAKLTNHYAGDGKNEKGDSVHISNDEFKDLCLKAIHHFYCIGYEHAKERYK